MAAVAALINTATLAAASANGVFNAVVATDGTGQYATIQQAIDDALPDARRHGSYS